MVIELLISTALAAAEPALPPHFSGVWCYLKYASQEAIEPVDIYARGESIEDCANRGGFTIWPNGRGYTFGRRRMKRALRATILEKTPTPETTGSSSSIS
jgi:hypothetical protein